MNMRRWASWILLAPAVSAGLIACGSSGSSSSAGSPPSSSTQSAAAAAAPSSSAEQAITANWTAFFNSKTPAARKVSLLQNGPEFASVLKAQASIPQAAASSAKVTKVTVITPSRATVTYDILLSGSPVLTSQKGTAVYQAGTWKVGDVSFCGLLTLEMEAENSGKTSSLPAACKAKT